MSIAARMIRCPRPYDPEQGEATRALFAGLAPEYRDLIAGAAGCSPFLRSLCQSEAGWLREALDMPEASFEKLLDEAARAPLDQTAPALRQAKRRIALLTGLTDLAGVWTLADVTARLSRFADLAVGCALRAAIEPELRRGKIPGQGEDDLASAGGMVVLAMGKMGAGELNYSSDIDLICLFDETRFDPGDYDTARAGFVRATRKMAALLNDRTEDGYVFRTDLRLRPDPAVTPVCLAMARAEAYYESLGRTWERAAYIKARAAAGDIRAGTRFLETLKPFVWRKHLDFAAIEDAHNMRLRIRAHKGLPKQITLPGHDMKLGRGGIREIEFFTQTQQLISGGRDAHLRARGTVEGMVRLAERGWIPRDVATDLSDHYEFHRTVEHRVQMIHDAQTHALPNQRDGFDRLAALMDCEREGLETELLDRLTTVHTRIETFFSPDGAASDPAPASSDTTPCQTDLDQTLIARWESYPALRSDRARQIFRRLQPDILSRLAASVDPKAATLALDGFLSGLPAGVQLLSMFEARPQLLDLLVDIAGTAPGLAAYLSRNARVFEAVVGGQFFSDWPGEAALTQELSDRLDVQTDYEAVLDATRAWAKEWHFRVGVHHLRGLIGAGEAGQQYADLAGAVVAALWPRVLAQFATKHGVPPGRGAVVVAMGSLGAGKLNAGSDLDLIVVYDAPGDGTSKGPRPLPTRTYYARVTQALITALTVPMAEGRLYEVDMRLRPSGNQGPVATSWVAFQSYQSDEAWVWEHLALTRARVVAGPDDLARDVEAFRRQLLARKGDKARVLAGVADMRARIAEAKAPAGALDTKLGPGRMQDIELLAQAGALIAAEPARDVGAGIAAGAQAGLFARADKTRLEEAYTLCWVITQVARLLGGRTLDPDKLGQGGCAMLLRETGHNSLEALQTGLDAQAQAAAQIIEAVLEQSGPHPSPPSGA
ncbi:MAG: bifunctional [glutamine synthetase] adenylyltransferase/[glutamine synthetase]-adenylyl-L-tyrosine phosphorylase [Pseudomonadota bacterium]